MIQINSQTVGWLAIGIVALGGIAFYSVRAERHGFDRFIAGQILMLFGWFLVALPPVVYPGAPQQVWNLFSALGFAGVFAGLALAWFGRKQRRSHSGGATRGSSLS